ncbi:hypothetical protein BGY98DRAFT_939727 [Russula aff. rugulosa BPL654]|nr:hypothetical protein BGY98DRAFT_939727 [Russula aff. rugulosa BPL654]
MSCRILSVAPPLVSLFFFSAFVVAQINVTANCTSLSWSFNSIGQSPCIIAAYMLGTCYGGLYTLPPPPPGDAYGGPTRETSNECECSTVGYSLMSACATCQERDPFSYSEYVINCTTIVSPSQFQTLSLREHMFLAGLFSMSRENDWNANESYTAGDSPEYGPGAIFGASGVYTSSASTSSVTTSSASASSTVPPKHSHSGSHAGAIVGGVIGGIAFIFIVVAAICLWVLYRALKTFTSV